MSNTPSRKVYATYHWYSGDYFLTFEYDRVEYYDHVEIAWDDIPERYQRDLRSYGFAVPANRRHYYDYSYGRIAELYNEGMLVPAKEVPSVAD